MAVRILTPLENDRLATCEDRLSRVIRRAVELGMPVKVLEAHRNKVAQDLLFAENKSKVKWPQSKHNSFPSRAVDIAPDPVLYPTEADSRYVYAKKVGRFYYLTGKIIMLAWCEFRIRLRPGTDWDEDGEILDQEFDDLGHLELVD